MTTVASQRRKRPRTEDPELRGRRSAPRAYIVLPASAEVISGHLRATLLDVSLTGARVEGRRLPGPGKDIILRCGNIDAFGTVAWATFGRCGISFDEPISGHELVALRELASDWSRSEMTADERQAAADWLNGLAR